MLFPATLSRDQRATSSVSNTSNTLCFLKPLRGTCFPQFSNNGHRKQPWLPTILFNYQQFPSMEERSEAKPRSSRFFTCGLWPHQRPRALDTADLFNRNKVDLKQHQMDLHPRELTSFRAGSPGLDLEDRNKGDLKLQTSNTINKSSTRPRGKIRLSNKISSSSSKREKQWCTKLQIFSTSEHVYLSFMRTERLPLWQKIKNESWINQRNERFSPFSVPVICARMRKERDCDVPVRGCQSSVSSIRRFLLASLSGDTWFTSISMTGFRAVLKHTDVQKHQTDA